MIEARHQALKALLAVSQGRSLATVLPPLLEPLNPQDKGFCQELCYGVLRFGHAYDFVLSQLISKPIKAKDRDIEFIIKLGLYQLYELAVPDYAAVTETVKLVNQRKKVWAKRLVNGVLRNAQRQQSELTRKLEEDTFASLSFPDWLAKFIKGNWPEHDQQIMNASNQRPPLFLRVNRQHHTSSEYQAILKDQGIESQVFAQAKGALLLEQAQDVTQLPGFEQGVVSVQDLAAQFAAQIVDPQSGQRILDACAAPGGKTCHLLEMMPDIDLLALDVDPLRLARVRENILRIHVASADRVQCVEADLTQLEQQWEAEWGEKSFDAILLDAPCSATGVIRRHPDIKWLRQAEDVAPLVELQAKCMDEVWAMLKLEGCLVYATCSVLKAENEHQVKRFLERHPDAQLECLDLPYALDTGFGSQFLPGNELQSDGFFYARLRKVHPTEQKTKDGV